MSKETWERVWAVVQLLAALAGGSVCVSVVFGPKAAPPTQTQAVPAVSSGPEPRACEYRQAPAPCPSANPQPLRTGTCGR